MCIDFNGIRKLCANYMIVTAKIFCHWAGFYFGVPPSISAVLAMVGCASMALMCEWKSQVSNHITRFGRECARTQSHNGWRGCSAMRKNEKLHCRRGKLSYGNGIYNFIHCIELIRGRDTLAHISRNHFHCKLDLVVHVAVTSTQQWYPFFCRSINLQRDYIVLFLWAPENLICPNQSFSAGVVHSKCEARTMDTCRENWKYRREPIIIIAAWWWSSRCVWLWGKPMNIHDGDGRWTRIAAFHPKFITNFPSRIVRSRRLLDYYIHPRLGWLSIYKFLLFAHCTGDTDKCVCAEFEWAWFCCWNLNGGGVCVCVGVCMVPTISNNPPLKYFYKSFSNSTHFADWEYQKPIQLNCALPHTHTHRHIRIWGFAGAGRQCPRQ